LVELRDVFDFPASRRLKRRNAFSNAAARFVIFFFISTKATDEVFRVRFTYFAKRTLAESGQIIPRFVESGASFRRRRRRIDAVSYSIAISAPNNVLFRKVRAFSSKKL
jgi:hypothetical protein